ncbi:H(+)/Cl(-) exchange transporter ClcA [Solirhodobacter olei]|uniref:H(+)/Cl(-) exchange transporter ClcA n=1 Tax=Solirhodobacter olei TaxID=2493082 RepID=UPI000FD854EE|nr:H(+)/Cl(-) exchange transporter ClcA [Solirhodobacter olei]
MQDDKVPPESERDEPENEEALHNPLPADRSLSRLLFVSLLAPVVGAGAGLVDAIFRIALDKADVFRSEMIARGHDAHALGFIALLLGSAAAAALGAWLVHRFSPHASGSGIPQIEAALNGELPPTPPRLLPVKFIGGLSAIGGGLALGREGPSVQMGAVVAHLVGQLFRHSTEELRFLLAAGAGAGLAVAFNAPIAGAVFVLEELVRRFEPRMTIVALATSSTAILVSRLFLGDAPDFQVVILSHTASATGPLPYAEDATWFLYIIFGAVTGVVASCYTRIVLGAQTFTAKFKRVPVVVKAGIIGAFVGTVGWFTPNLVGGGNNISQTLLAGGVVYSAIPLAFVIRFLLGPISYAARTPGGLFAPLLVLGAQLGLLFGAAAAVLFPHLGIEPEAFAVVGMAALFTGIVQAPVTGIILVTEMTAAFTTLLPMLAACFTSMLVVHLLRTEPIYDSLLERVVKEAHATSTDAKEV